MNFVKNKKLVTYFLIFLFFSFLVGVNFSLAEDAPTNVLPGTGSCDCSEADKIKEKCKEVCKHYYGDYSLNEIVSLLPRVAQLMLGIVGSLALLMFIYGGVMFLISSGSSERVTQAKQILISAVIGLVIVFTSYMIIGFVFRATGTDPSGTAWSNTGWFTK